MRLIIVESPAKCQKIQGFLGPGHTVIASMGHIRALAHDLDAVGINNNFEPTYEFLKEKAKAIKQLTDASKGATSVILCADDDREGEAIAYSVAVLLKLNIATNPRAAFREITRNAVLDAVNNPRTIDMNRVNSQQSRAMLDMMVGFTISPLLWSYVGPALSAGRCQTPALRLVVERERIIETFKSEGSWLISGEWSTTEKPVNKNSVWPAVMTESLSDEESAQNYLENHKDNKVGIVKKAETKPWTESAPLALMTSTLQQQASNLYHCNPKKTMQIAQKLYEAGHITYMRTDQETMSEEAVENAKKVILAKWGPTYVKTTMPPVAVTALTKTKKATAAAAAAAELPKAQEAHEAIRPTHFENSQLPEGEDWGLQEKKIYHLIWLRAIQSVMSAAKGDNRLVTFEAEGDDGDFEWLAKWRRTTFPGWKAADEKDAKISEAQDSETNETDASDVSWKLGESLAPTQRVYWQLLLAKPQESKPPGRYTEASLVRELEKKGIGRPSTFASLIATLLEKAYVETKDIVQEIKESKTYSLTTLGQWPPTLSPFQLKKGGEKLRMVPTALGRSLLDFTVKNFPDLFAYEFTAAMEKRLDQIAEGKEPWKQVLGDTWNSYKDRLATLKKAPSAAAGSGGAGGNANPKVREFGNGLKAVLSAKGPLLLKEGETKEQTVFYGWPGSKSFQSLTESEALAFIENAGKQKVGEAFGEFEGEQILQKSGKFGSYFEWKGIRVSAAPGDSPEIAIKKLQEKATAPPVRQLGPFQVRTGQYGPYLMKVVGGKDKPQFVNIPAGTDLDSLTAQQAGEIFEAGLKAKAAGGAKAGGKGGGGFKKFKKKE